MIGQDCAHFVQPPQEQQQQQQQQQQPTQMTHFDPSINSVINAVINGPPIELSDEEVQKLIDTAPPIQYPQSNPNEAVPVEKKKGRGRPKGVKRKRDVKD